MELRSRHLQGTTVPSVSDSVMAQASDDVPGLNPEESRSENGALGQVVDEPELCKITERDNYIRELEFRLKMQQIEERNAHCLDEERNAHSFDKERNSHSFDKERNAHSFDKERNARYFGEERNARHLDEERNAHSFDKERNAHCLDEERNARYFDEERNAHPFHEERNARYFGGERNAYPSDEERNARQVAYSNSFGSRGSGDNRLPKLPNYNGKGPWKPFWIQFELLSRRHGWDSDEQCERLICNLRDGAMEFVSQLPTEIRKDLHELVSALKRRFGDHVLPETRRATLQNIKRNTEETIDEYASRVTDLVTKAYPGIAGSDLFNKLTVEHIVQGLGDSSLSYDIMTKKPNTVAEAIDMIQWHECCKLNTKRKSNIRRVDTFSDSNDESDVNVRRTGRHRFVTEERLQRFRERTQGVHR